MVDITFTTGKEYVYRSNENVVTLELEHIIYSDDYCQVLTFEALCEEKSFVSSHIELFRDKFINDKR